MKSALLTIAFFFLSTCYTTAQIPERVLDYYKLINNAELAICGDDIKSASQFYSKAFAVHPKRGFYRDVLNAIHISMDINQLDTAGSYLKTLANRGLTAEMVKSFQKLYTGNKLAFINKIITTNKKPSAQEKKLVNRLKQMVAKDQEVRIYFSKLYNGAYMVDSTYAVDEANAQALLAMFKVNGIPDESILHQTDYDIIILHNTGAASGGRTEHIFDTLLFEASCSFDFDMRHFAYIAERSALAPAFSYKSLNVSFPLMPDCRYHKGDYYIGYYDGTSESHINKERKKLGLESLDDYRKKILFTNKNRADKNLQKYSMVGFLTIAQIDDEKDLQNWLSVNGVDAKNKPSLSKIKFYHQKREPFDIGVIGQYEVGATGFDTVFTYFKKTGEWFVADVPYKTKNGFKHDTFGYFAEMVKNNNEDCTTSVGTNNLAKFVDGYRLLATSGYSFWALHISNPELSFYNGVLMAYTGKVDTNAPKIISKYIAPQTKIERTYDTVSADYHTNVVLNTTKYTWVKGDNRTEVIVKDHIVRNKKRTEAIYTMYDTRLYNEYLKKVEEEKNKIRRECKGNKK